MDRKDSLERHDRPVISSRAFSESVRKPEYRYLSFRRPACRGVGVHNITLYELELEFSPQLPQSVLGSEG